VEEQRGCEAAFPGVTVGEKRTIPANDTYIGVPAAIGEAKATASGPSGAGATDLTGLATGVTQEGSTGTDPFNLAVPAARNEIVSGVVAHDVTGTFKIQSNFGPLGSIDSGALNIAGYASDAAFATAIKNGILNATDTGGLLPGTFAANFGAAVNAQSGGLISSAVAQSALSAGLVVTAVRPDNVNGVNGSFTITFGSSTLGGALPQPVGLGFQNLGSVNFVTSDPITQVSTLTPDNHRLFAGGTSFSNSTDVGGTDPGHTVIASQGPGVYSLGWAFSGTKAGLLPDTQALSVMYPQALVPDLSGIGPATLAILQVALGTAVTVDTSRCGVVGLIGLFCSADPNGLGPDLAGLCGLF